VEDEDGEVRFEALERAEPIRKKIVRTGRKMQYKYKKFAEM
jgi:hypothetical protein